MRVKSVFASTTLNFRNYFLAFVMIVKVKSFIDSTIMSLYLMLVRRQFNILLKLCNKFFT